MMAPTRVERPTLGALSDAQLDSHIKSLDAKARAAQSELALARRERKARRKAAAKLLEAGCDKQVQAAPG